MLATPRTKIASAADDLRASGQVEVVGDVCSNCRKTDVVIRSLAES
jgi:hypothetical protein